MICFLLVCVLAMPAIITAEAQSYTGILKLDHIQSQIQTGSTVVFSGQLTTTSGHYVPGATIYIKDDVSFGRDDTIRRVTTDSNGKFYTTWTAQPRSSGSWDFYAVFEGSSQVSKARSTEYSVKVSSSYSNNSGSNYKSEPTYYTTSITLNRIPNSVRDGDSVTFTGQLASGKYAVNGAIIKIKEADFGPDQTLASGYTDSNGRFSITWTAREGSVETDFDIYATFEGSSNYKKSKSSEQVMSVYGKTKTFSVRPDGELVRIYDTSLTLSKIPSSVHAGDSVTFTGQLTSDGQAVSGATIKIKEDDPALPDQTLVSGKTNSNGVFSIPWTVRAGTVEVDFDIYAVFERTSSYKKDRTSNQQMSVLKYGGSITLDSLPGSARIGDVIIFSGMLNLEGFNPEGAVVYIKDEDPFTGDDLLATGYVDRNGGFSANWFVDYVDSDITADIYAVYEGNDTRYRLTTCDKGPTKSFGGSCKYTIPLKILDAIPAIPSPDTTPTGNQYMELYYARNLFYAPHVAIVPSPDSYNEVRGHITLVQEGIMMWEERMEQQYGGTWDVSFEVISPGSTFQSRPDIVVNLVTKDEDAGCFEEYAGWAEIFKTPPKTIQTVVCSVNDGHRRSNVDVSATAAHEFIHAMGLGHTFNKKGDMMCSVEDGKPTCKNSYSKSKMPSSLNLAAVAKIYGTDGFRNPNNQVQNGERFSTSNPSYNVPDPPKPKSASYCERIYDNYNWEINEKTLKSGWYSYWKICSDKTSYSFATDNENDGVTIFVLPPATNVKDFMDNRDGRYYLCEEYEVVWHKKSNTCNIAPGSHIVISNTQDNTITVNGYIRNK